MISSNDLPGPQGPEQRQRVFGCSPGRSRNIATEDQRSPPRMKPMFMVAMALGSFVRRKRSSASSEKVAGPLPAPPAPPNKRMTKKMVTALPPRRCPHRRDAKNQQADADDQRAAVVVRERADQQAGEGKNPHRIELEQQRDLLVVELQVRLDRLEHEASDGQGGEQREHREAEECHRIPGVPCFWPRFGAACRNAVDVAGGAATAIVDASVMD